MSEPQKTRNTKLVISPKPIDCQYTSPTREPEIQGINERKILETPFPIITKSNKPENKVSMPITAVGVSNRQRRIVLRLIHLISRLIFLIHLLHILLTSYIVYEKASYWVCVLFINYLMKEV